MVRRNSLGRRCEQRSLRRSNLSALFLILFLTGCVTAPPTPTAVPVIEATASPMPTSAPVNEEPEFVGRVRNAQYQLGASDTLQVVQLTDGVYETGTAGGADYVSVNMLNFVASGDLNRDGRAEVVALVAENYGGTGTFVFLTVYTDANNTLTFQTSLMIDDRPSVNAMSIDNGEIFLDVVTHGLEDPFCCPTLHTSRHYHLTQINQLDLVDYSTFTPAGDPRTITIDAPPNGAQASNTVQVRGKVAIAPFENTLAYRIYDVGGVELAAGAIDVTATDLGAPGVFDSVIKLGNILSGAVIRLEIQDISAKDSSLLAMDSVELVVK